MTARPIFDTAAAWDALSPAEQRAIGIAAIDHELMLAGSFLEDQRAAAEFEQHAADCEEALQFAVGRAVRLDAAESLPLPSVAAEYRRCRECGCTDALACDGGCSWVEEDLCGNPACVAAAAQSEPEQSHG
jgi:hypothetical protein